MNEQERYTVFADFAPIADGNLEVAVGAAKSMFDESPETRVLVFDNETGRQVDFDLSGPAEEVVPRETAAKQRKGRGRPKMGVECGEVCLLPRHWEWLAAQPRSASATIRRMIDAARKSETPQDRLRERIDAVGTFMWGLAGDLPDFEEASRALYKQDWAELNERMRDWPEGVQAHVRRMLEGVAG